MTRIGKGPIAPPPQLPSTPSQATQASSTLPNQQNAYEVARPPSSTTPGVPSGTNLQQQVQSGQLVRRGQQGPAVTELQEMLNRAGVQPPLQTDGTFGRRTEAALRQFQTQHNIRVDGLFGPESLGAISPNSATNRSPTPSAPTLRVNDLQQQANAQRARSTTPPTTTPSQFAPEPGRVTTPFAATQTEREQQAESILRANGQWPPQEGRAYAIQIDQDAPPGSASRSERNNYVRAYTGQTSVFRVEHGQLVEQTPPLRSASHPGQYTTRAAPDVSGDGSSDIAHIRPGVYTYRSRTSGDRFNPTSNRQFEVARDINHNGVIDGSERSQRHSATGIQIHAGRDSRPSSIGCQTMPPQDYRQFQQAIRQANIGNQQDFTYILVRRPNEAFGENRF